MCSDYGCAVVVGPDSVVAVSVASGSPVTKKITPKTSAKCECDFDKLRHFSFVFVINPTELQFMKFPEELLVISQAKYLLE